MRRNLLFGVSLVVTAACLYFIPSPKPLPDVIPKDQFLQATTGKPKKKKDGYDQAAARDLFTFEQIKDPSLGYVPMERMMKAVDYTENVKLSASLNRTAQTLGVLNWMERGPVYDFVGPSNGNSRGPGTPHTSGRTKAVFIDTLNDPTGNTVFCGGVAGGLWKCSNFLSGIPNWQSINDRFDNLAISSICQDPSAPAVMYFCTGEATSNADAVYGGGVWKSVNAGTTWVKLPTSTGFLRGFKIVCDAAGNVYLANRNTNPPSSSASGLYRSKDGGSSWQVITPAVRTSGNAIPTDIEISSGGRLHASFGYMASAVQHQYTDDAANVLPAAGWNASTGIRTNSLVVANRLEMATSGDVLYAVTINSANNVDSSYKSIDNGATWTKQNTAAYTPQITNTQGWYDLTLAVNPSNTNEFMVGGLDAYKSSNSGLTVTRQTFWVSSAPYVHADHQFMQWWNVGDQSRVVIGCDGGVFLSNDGGATFVDKNRNLGIKQFYDGAIHPAAGSPYLLAGAQDNGVHQLKNDSLSFSTEVTGGDGCFVHINQQNPQVQFGSYVFNSYRRSTDGGNTWSSFTFGSNGLFVNPFDYDDGQNIMYASNGVQNAPNNQILRWADANTSSTASVFTINGLTRASAGNPTTLKVSPFTSDRVYIGASNGKLVRLSNAGKVTAATINDNVTDLTGASFPTANISCVNVGQTDDFLVATFSNYGVGHVWFSTNGGTSWTLIDGTPGSGGLPDMPVRWALIDPQNNSRIFLATEAGVYSTDLVNGANTVWNADTNFPTVRTDALELRLSDNTMVAATHGRGLYTAVIPSIPEIRFSSRYQFNTEASTGTVDCRGYRDYTVNVSAVAAPTGDATVTYSVKAGSTATEGIDFDFTTNGSFTTPSKTQTFTTGVAASKIITVRIYDDAALEPEENFTITFGVSGSTNAFAGSYNSYTFTITDNDVAPVTPVPATAYTAGAFTLNVNGASPFRSNLQKHRAQVLYRASELTALGATAGRITSLTTRVVTKNSTKPYNGYTISIKNTPVTNLSGNFETGLTQVYTGNYTSVAGDNVFAFGTGAGSASGFTWDGTSNIVVQFCFDNSAGAADLLADIMEGSNPFGTGTAADNYASIYSNAGTGAGCSLGAAFISNNRISAKFVLAIAGNPPEILFNASKTAYLSPNDDVYFYGSTGNIIARIKNLSGANFACTQVKIDRAGTGAAPFWNNDPANYLTSKTLQVVPTTNNPSGQYQITLYYTAAEKAGWELATGRSWNSIQMVKVKSQIQNYSPISLFPDGVGAVEAATPTFGTFGSNFTLTATFSTGFSGFGAGIIGFPLPVALTTFTGRLDNNTASLNWSTSSEQNSKNFDIEKSIDGINYYHIGTVQAAGSSSSRKDYGLRDDKLSAFNYYRLKMNDLDGRNKLSNIVLVKYDVKAQNVWVINNPFNSFIDLRLAKEATQAKLQLVSANGAVVAEKSVTNASGIIHWQLAGNISAGSYILRTVVDGKVFTHKLVKQ